VSSVIRAGEADAGPLSEVIAEAFFGLAPSRWLVPDPDTRRRIFPGYFRLLVEQALADGVVCTTPDRSAVALWLPADARREGYQTRLAEVTGPWAARFAAFDAALDRHHPAGVAHQHLAILAVSPAGQGRGTGSALLRARHAELDRDGVPAYLEAAGQGSRDLYLRHGYAPWPAYRLPDGGPPMWPMWRAPRTAGNREPRTAGNRETWSAGNREPRTAGKNVRPPSDDAV
jgi:GNAT superfamily N-acetyltransferase